jgi:m7GpppX diphosphatase
MFTETPEHYRTIVKPFIDAFPASRTQWYATVSRSGVPQQKLTKT